MTNNINNSSLPKNLYIEKTKKFSVISVDNRFYESSKDKAPKPAIRIIDPNSAVTEKISNKKTVNSNILKRVDAPTVFLK